MFVLTKPGGVLGLIGVGLLLLSIALHILCMSTPYYFTLSDSDMRKAYLDLSLQHLPNTSSYGLSFGLWRLCVDGLPNQSDTFCYTMGNNTFQEPSWLRPGQALSIIAVVVAGAGIIFYLAWSLNKITRRPHCLLVTTIVCCVVGGILVLSGDISLAAEKTIEFYAKQNSRYFIRDNTPDNYHWIPTYDKLLIPGWSFILDLISGSLCIIAGVVYLIALFMLVTISTTETWRGKNGKVDSINNADIIISKM